MYQTNKNIGGIILNKKTKNKLSEMLITIILIVSILLLLIMVVFLCLTAPYLFIIIQCLASIHLSNTSFPIYEIKEDFLLSIINFLTTTILSFLVYKLSKNSVRNEKRSATLNVVSYFELSSKSIENYNSKVISDLPSYFSSINIYTDLIKINIKKKDFLILEKFYGKIEKIFHSKDKDNLPNLCEAITKDSEYSKLKEIIKDLREKNL